MTFNQVLSGKKLIIFAVILALLSGFGLEIYSRDLEWNFNNIPEKWRFALEVSNPNSSKGKVYIGGYFFTKSVAEKAFDARWEEIIETRDNWQKAMEDYESGADTLFLFIEQNSDKSFPFELNKFAFTQGQAQYGWDSHFNIKPINSTLKVATYWGGIGAVYGAHSLRPGVAARGYISLPDNIDLSKSFKIWYGSYSEELNAEGLDTEQ